MSFVPAPQQANIASASAKTNEVKPSNAVTATADEAVGDDGELIFKIRTFDVYWVDKYALMYKAGIDKTFDKKERKATVVTKMRSSIPVILRDMAPPEGSIFDPAKKWEEEKKRRAEIVTDEAKEEAAATAAAESKGKKSQKGGQQKIHSGHHQGIQCG